MSASNGIEHFFAREKNGGTFLIFSPQRAGLADSGVSVRGANKGNEQLSCNASDVSLKLCFYRQARGAPRNSGTLRENIVIELPLNEGVVVEIANAL